MRLGLFGGTFDPPHIGHLIAAQDAIAALRLDRVLFIPAGVPPHKRGQVVSTADHRRAMLQTAISGDERFAMEPLELERDGPSYTVDTAAELTRKYPGDELFLLIGADQFRDFGTWREPERLASLVRVAVLSRDGALPATAGLSVDALPVSVTRIDISSSEVRRRRAAGEPTRYLVPAGVEAYMDENSLYRH